MNIQTEKLDIIQWLAGVSDDTVIRQFKLLKISSQENSLVELTNAQKEAIDKGLKSIEEGKYQRHEEVMINVRKKYSNLFK